MAERIRVFLGVTELSNDEVNIKITDDHVVNNGIVGVTPDSAITSSSVLDLRKKDGVTTIFNARVEELDEDVSKTAKIFVNGYELQNTKVETVFVNTSPEDIVKDIIDNRTDNLTYASTEVSGVVLEKYLADAYAIDIIMDMIFILRWSFRIDENDNVFFSPRMTIDNGFIFTDGVNTRVDKFKEDKFSVVNQVKVIGGFKNFSTEETIIDNTTIFFLAERPEGTVRVVDSGTEVDPSTYEVDPDEKKITFDVTRSNPTFFYSFNRPIVIQSQDEASINLHGTRFKEVLQPALIKTADVRAFAKGFLAENKDPRITATVTQSMNFERSTNELVTVIDAKRNKNVLLVINKISHSNAEGTTTFECGPRISELFDWQTEVQQRIKKIERAINSDTQVTFARSFENTTDTEMTHFFTVECATPVDSFILGHPTLGRLRSGLDMEADCSNFLNNGIWQGTGVTTGSQYSTSGRRLSAGVFNGTDNFIDTDDALFSIQNVSFSIEWDGTDAGIFQLNSSDRISVSSGTITTTGLTGVSIFVNNVATSSIPTGSFADVSINFDSTTVDDLETGNNSDGFFSGKLDEVMIFSQTLDSAQRILISDLSDFDIYDKDNVFKVPNLELYYSMDNPRLGDRSSTPESVQNVIALEDFSTNDNKSTPVTSDWNNSLKRLAMNTETSHAMFYSTTAKSTNYINTQNNVLRITLTADETKFGNDLVKYFVNLDNNDSHFEEVFVGVKKTMTFTGKSLRWQIVMLGNGAKNTFIENLSIQGET